MDETVSLLVRLQRQTKSRAENGMDVEATIEIYAENCLGYPADVVRHVLKTHANMGVFWPAWSEIKERLDLYSGYRTKLRAALINPPKPEPEAPPRVSPAQIDEHLSKLRNRAKVIASEPMDETAEEFEARKAEYQ